MVLREVCRPFTTERALNTPLTPERIDILIDEAAPWVEQDQASRLGRSGARDMAAVDADTTTWLKAVLRESGWPSANRSDVTLVSDAWLLAQHGDRTPTVQACVLDLITQQRSTPQEAHNYAYLTDREWTRAGVRHAGAVRQRAEQSLPEPPGRSGRRRPAPRGGRARTAGGVYQALRAPPVSAPDSDQEPGVTEEQGRTDCALIAGAPAGQPPAAGRRECGGPARAGGAPLRVPQLWF